MTPSADQRRVAAQQYERARQAMTTGNFDYSIELLRTCCRIDPSNLVYRMALRRTQKSKYKNNLRGSVLAWLTTAIPKARLQKARQTGNHLKVLEYGEVILSANPWATRTQLDMADAAENLGLIDVAVWVLEQARQKNPRNAKVNRRLAELYEKHGNFTQAIAMWDLVLKSDPHDLHAARKCKDLAATDTIVKGKYQEAHLSETGERVIPTKDNAPAPTAPVDNSPMARQAEPFKKKIESDPTNPGPYLQLASIYQKAGKLEEARSTLEQGLDATGKHFEIQLALNELEIEPFRQNLAITEQKLKETPNDPNLRTLREQLRKEINTREIDCFRARADRFPSELGHRLELGVRLLWAGQTEAAIQELQQARRDPKHRHQALMQLGYCFQARKNWVLARRNFSEALQAAPPGEEDTRKELMLQLALLAAQEGDLTTAVELGTELADIDFAYQDIGRRLEEWQARLEEARTG